MFRYIPWFPLFLHRVHSEGVQQRAQDGDRRADDRSGRHGSLERHDARDDDHDALDGVPHGVGDGINLTEGEERDLVVQVVGGTAEGEERREGLVREGPALHGGLEGGEEGGALDGEHHRDQHDRGHGREDCVQVLGVEVLPDLLPAHGLLGEHAPEGRGHVREHRRGEREHGEGKLLHGRDGHPADDGEEGGVDLHRQDLAEEEGVATARHDRLGRLDDVSEGDGAGAEGDDGTDVNAGVAEGDGDQGLQLVETELGGLAQAEEPEGHEVEDARGHLDGRDGPREGEGVESLLVVDVVPDVEEVPQGEVGPHLESLLHARAGVGGGCGPAGGGEG